MSVAANPKNSPRTIGSTVANRPEIATGYLTPELIKAMFKVGVFVPDALLKMCGSLVAAHLMAQFIFVSELEDTTKRHGWSYLTAREMKDRLFIGRAEQETARRILVDELGILEQQKKGLPGKLHFRVKWDELTRRLSQFAQKQQTSLPDASEPVCRAAANKLATFAQTGVREKSKHLILSESTAESSPPLTPPSSGGISHDDLLQDRNYGLVDLGREGYVIVRIGRTRRLFTKAQMDSMAGARIEDVLRRVGSMGYWAEIYQAAPDIPGPALPTMATRKAKGAAKMTSASSTLNLFEA